MFYHIICSVIYGGVNDSQISRALALINPILQQPTPDRGKSVVSYIML
jgi:hypothetical protein